MTAEPNNPLQALESLSCSEIETWLERALRGDEPLPLAARDERPFLAIARHHRALDDIRRLDLRRSTEVLVRRYARHGDANNDYVASLLGLVDELQLREAELPLCGLATSERFDDLPEIQQSRVLGTLFDLHVPLDDEYWIRWANAGRHQGLALNSLLAKGLRGLELLPQLEVDLNTADTLSLVLSRHCRKLDPVGQERMLRLGRDVVGRCSGEMRAAVQDWLDEYGTVVDVQPSVDEDHPNVIQGEFFAAFNGQNGSMYLGVESTTARLAV